MTRRAHTVIPRVGSAYRPLRPLKSSAEPFSILINLRDNRYRCLDLTDPWSTTAVRTTSNVGACPVVPPSHCGYRQGEPSPYLVSRVLLVELEFRGFGNSREIRAGAKHASNVGRTFPVVPDDIPLASTVGSPDSLPFKDTS